MLLPREMLINKNSKKLYYLNLLDADIVKVMLSLTTVRFCFERKKK